MRRTTPTCTECGARLAPEEAQCTLCGWPVGQGEVAAPASAARRAPSDDAPGDPVFCNACGWKNPAGACFCSKCGEAVQRMPVALKARPAALPPKPERRAASRMPAPAGQVGIIVGAALALIVALFLVTNVSNRTASQQVMVPPASESAVPAITPVPLSGALAGQIATLDREIAGDSGLVRITRQREKAYLLMQSGRTDLAAIEYSSLAASTGSSDDWRIAGDLYYDWMSDTEDGASRGRIAMNAVAAYEKVLERNPDDLGVRTDLATAYLNTGSPMQGVTEIKRVLEADPNHLDANFNYGLMLWRIGRNEQAAAQFEKVMDLAGNPSEHFSRASEALQTLERQDPL